MSELSDRDSNQIDLVMDGPGIGCNFCRRRFLRLFSISRRVPVGASLRAFICDLCIDQLAFADKVCGEHDARQGS